MLTFRSIWPLFDSLSNRQQQRILAILNLRRFSTALIADSRMIYSIDDKFLGCHTVKAHLPINANDRVTLDNLFWGSCPGLLIISGPSRDYSPVDSSHCIPAKRPALVGLFPLMATEPLKGH